MNLNLAGKHALVCGASAGIGRACAMQLAAQGARVTVASRDEKKLAGVVAELARVNIGVGGGATGEGSGKHLVLAVDLSKPEEAEVAVRGHIAAHGPVHVVVNNTGGPPAGAMEGATAAQLRTAFDSLLVAAHLVTLAALPGMKEAKFGRVVNISSTSVKQPIANLGLSNAVRAAVSNWAKTLSQEVGKFGITVNTVLPGYTDTDRLGSLFAARSTKTGMSVEAIREEAMAAIPAGRLGLPEEIAAAVGFLCSPAAGYINGVQLPVDGGRLGCL